MGCEEPLDSDISQLCRDHRSDKLSKNACPSTLPRMEIDSGSNEKLGSASLFGSQNRLSTFALFCGINQLNKPVATKLIFAKATHNNGIRNGFILDISRMRMPDGSGDWQTGIFRTSSLTIDLTNLMIVNSEPTRSLLGIKT